MSRCLTKVLLGMGILGLSWLARWAVAQPPAGARAATTVRDLGAKGDGQADDTAAIQQAADRGGEIRFGSGTYRITRQIVIDLERVGYTSVVGDGTATLVMAGAGPALKFLGTHRGTADPNSVKENSGSDSATRWSSINTFFLGHQHNLLVEDYSQIVIGPNLFERNPDYPPGSRDGLVLSDCSDCTLNGWQVFNTLADQGAPVLRRCRRVNMTGCTILDCNGCGLLLEDIQSVRVSGCLVRDDRPAAARPVALRLTGGRGNMIVSDCQIA